MKKSIWIQATVLASFLVSSPVYADKFDVFRINLGTFGWLFGSMPVCGYEIKKTEKMLEGFIKQKTRLTVN